MKYAYARYHNAVRTLAICCGWLLLLFSLMTCISSALRYAFNISISGVDEYGGYILAVAGALGFSFAALERKHIRIELVREYLPERLRSMLDVFAMIFLAATALVLVWLASRTWTTSFNMGALSSTPMRTPLVVPQGIWLFFLGLFALTTLLMAASALIALCRGDFVKVNEMLGSESLEDEVTRELEEFQSRMKKSSRG